MLKTVVWSPLALADRDAIFEYIARDNPFAAIALDNEFKDKAELARQRPLAYRSGLVRDTRELVVRANYLLIYKVIGDDLRVLRIKHARQRWP
jgi:addiction module RelE/StbE family toxin